MAIKLSGTTADTPIDMSSVFDGVASHSRIQVGGMFKLADDNIDNDEEIRIASVSNSSNEVLDFHLITDGILRSRATLTTPAETMSTTLTGAFGGYTEWQASVGSFDAAVHLLGIATRKSGSPLQQAAVFTGGTVNTTPQNTFTLFGGPENNSGGGPLVHELVITTGDFRHKLDVYLEYKSVTPTVLGRWNFKDDWTQNGYIVPDLSGNGNHITMPVGYTYVVDAPGAQLSPVSNKKLGGGQSFKYLTLAGGYTYGVRQLAGTAAPTGAQIKAGTAPDGLEYYYGGNVAKGTILTANFTTGSTYTEYDYFFTFETVNAPGNFPPTIERRGLYSCGKAVVTLSDVNGNLRGTRDDINAAWFDSPVSNTTLAPTDIGKVSITDGVGYFDLSNSALVSGDVGHLVLDVESAQGSGVYYTANLRIPTE